jgi:hypothetical protein
MAHVFDGERLIGRLDTVRIRERVIHLDPARRYVAQPEVLGEILDYVTDTAIAEKEAKESLANAVTAARSFGFSWAVIAEHLGVSRQAAFKRFAERVRELDVLPQ